MPYAISGLLLIYNMDKGIKDRETSSADLKKYTTMKYICGDRVKGVYGHSRPKNPRMNALTRLPKHKNIQKMPRGIHYGAPAATKWTNTSLTSKEIFFFFR